MSAPVRRVRRPPLASVLSALRDSPIGIFAFRRDGTLRTLTRSRGLPHEAVDLRRGGTILGTPEATWRRALEGVLAGGTLQTRLRVGDRVAELRIEPWRDARGEVVGGVGLSVDVRDREEALQRLRQRQRQLRRITDHLGDVLAELDPDGRVRFVTPSVRTLYRREPEEVVGRVPLELVHPDDRPRVERAFRRAMREGHGYDIEARVLRPDGEVRWTTSRAERVHTAEGVTRVLLFTRDVTDQREAQRQRERRAALMQGISETSRELLDLTPEAADAGLEAALERAGRLTGADAMTLYAVDPHTFEQQRIGWSRDGTSMPPMPGRRDAIRMVWLGRQLARRGVVQVTRLEDWPPEAEPERERMRADGVRSALILGVRADARLVGTLQLLGLEAPRVFPEDDLPALRLLADMLVGAFRRKLTWTAMERGRALEAEVARLSRRFIRQRGAEVARAFPDAMALALRIARGEVAVLRAPRDDGTVDTLRHEASGPSPLALPPADACPWIEAELAAGRAVVLSDLQSLPREAAADVHRLREAGVGSLLAVPLRTAEGPPGRLAVLTRDRERLWSREERALVERVVELLVRVLDRERGEHRLRERQAAVRQSQKMDAVGRLAGGIAHEFNNLLMVIAGHAEALGETLEEDGEAAADLREIEAASERAAALTRQLLTLRGPRASRPVPLRVDQVIREGERVWRRALGEACRLRLDLAAGEAAIRGERSDVEQILLNLLVNARDAMPEGGGVDVSTRRLPPPDAADGPGTVELVVEDHGPGIPEERVPDIFEPFFSTKSAGRGTGLGLSIVRHAAERLGARVEVEGRPGRGARFRVRIPETVQPAADRPAGADLPAPLRGTGTILLAEDEDGVRRLMRRILQSAGYTVLEARDGAEALERVLAEPERVDALVSDVVMPRIGGGRLLHALRQRGIRIPVLFVSGYPQDVDGLPDQTEGGRLLYKPFTREALLRAVAEMLDA